MSSHILCDGCKKEITDEKIVSIKITSRCWTDSFFNRAKNLDFCENCFFDFLSKALPSKQKKMAGEKN